MTWNITGRITPMPDGSMEVDLSAVRSAATRAASGPKVGARTEDDIVGAVEMAKQEIGPSLQDLAASMVDLMARQNKRGQVSLGRALREVYAPLAKAKAQYGVEALAYGMEQAVSRGKPNVNYAKKAASSWGSEGGATPPPATPPSPGRYDILGGGTQG